MGRTTDLRRALKAVFFPVILSCGFTLDGRNQPRSVIFRRRATSAVQMVEVQWDKYGRPRFVLLFGTCPAEGLRLDDVVIPPDETLPTWCADIGSLQPRRGTATRTWFRQDATVLQRVMGRPALRAPDEVVNELVELFPELERYWADGEVGPHLRLWRLRA